MACLHRSVQSFTMINAAFRPIFAVTGALVAELITKTKMSQIREELLHKSGMIEGYRLDGCVICSSWVAPTP